MLAILVLFIAVSSPSLCASRSVVPNRVPAGIFWPTKTFSSVRKIFFETFVANDVKKNDLLNHKALNK
jgi:hypothetical protein